MDPNLIARILAQARGRMAPGMQSPYQVAQSSAPVPPQDPQNFYAQMTSPIQGRQMPGGINQQFLPNQGAEQALAAQGGPQMNPIIRQIMQHLGLLNMLRNRSAQPFMVEGQGGPGGGF